MRKRAIPTILVCTLIAAAGAIGCGGESGGTESSLSPSQQASLTGNVAKLARSLGTVATDTGECAAQAGAKGTMKVLNDCANRALGQLSQTVSTFKDDVSELIGKTRGKCKDGLTKVQGDLSKASDELADVSGEVKDGEMAPFVSTTSRLAPVLAKIQGDLGTTLSDCRR